MQAPQTFQVGKLYTHEEVYGALKVGNAGGIRPNLDKGGAIRRLVVMTSEPTARMLHENPYHDRIEGDVLVYTAAGREGRQEFSGINRRFLEQRDSPFPIYGFSNIGSRRNTKLGPRRWRFLGLLQYLRHFTETQIDARGQRREALVFELCIHGDLKQVSLEHERELSAQLCQRPHERNGPDETDRVAAPSFVTSLIAPVDNIIAENIRRSLLTLSADRFEHVVKDALTATGFERVAVTRFSVDGGIDVNAFASAALWTFRGALLQVQAKRWLHTVGRREVAELRGSMEPHAQGAVVTTSFFTKAALQEAAEATKKPIVLVNGLEFAAVLVRAGLTDLNTSSE